MKRSPLLTLLALLALAAGLGACGGGGDDSTSTAATASSQARAQSTARRTRSEARANATRAGKRSPSGSSAKGGGGGAKPEKPASLATDPGSIAGAVVTAAGAVQTLPPSNASQAQAMHNTYPSIESFGSEAKGSEATDITFALVQYLSARAQGEWATACARLYSVLREKLSTLAESANPTVQNGGCPAAYETLTRRAPQSVRAEEAKIDVASVRREGEKAFVIYKTPATLSADMPMYLDGGVWTVGALEAYALTPKQAEESR